MKSCLASHRSKAWLVEEFGGDCGKSYHSVSQKSRRAHLLNRAKFIYRTSTEYFRWFVFLLEQSLLSWHFNMLSRVRLYFGKVMLFGAMLLKHQHSTCQSATTIGRLTGSPPVLFESRHGFGNGELRFIALSDGRHPAEDTHHPPDKWT